MPGNLLCKTRLELNPDLRVDYRPFFYDSMHDYKYYFYMKNLHHKKKNTKVKLQDDSKYTFILDDNLEPETSFVSKMIFLLKCYLIMHLFISSTYPQRLLERPSWNSSLFSNL